MIKVYNARDIMEAQEIESILWENGIPAYHQDASGGIVGYTVPGFGLFGVDIYVDDTDKERAESIIEEVDHVVWDSDEAEQGNADPGRNEKIENGNWK